MLSGILKLTLFINIVFVFVAIIWQAAAIDSTPTSGNHDNLAKSKGVSYKKLRLSQRFRPILDYRLKRFRMLDPDEFKEMLNSMGQQTPYEQSKGYNNLDTIGGMQVENYWSRK